MKIHNYHFPDSFAKDDTIHTSLDFQDNKSKDRITISILDEEYKSNHRFEISKKEVQELITKGDNYIQHSIQKEMYYVKAIKNLIKKNNFLDLSLQLAEDQITEEEYEEEIDNFPEKYIIDVNCLSGTNELLAIVDIVKKIDLNFYNDEVAEIFGFREEDIEGIMNDLLG